MLRPWNHICQSRSVGVSTRTTASRFGRLFGSRGSRSASRRHSRKMTVTAATESLETRQLLAATPIAGLSDEFDDTSTIADWQRLHEVEGWNADQLQQWDVDQTQAGRMTMTPETVVWYGSWRGPMAFKEVTGDFVFTTQVHVTDRDDIGSSDADDVPGDGQYSLGGVMIRTPRDITNPETDWTAGSMADDGTNNGENYVFLSLGYGAGGNEFSLEVKTTRNSNSQLELTALGQEASVVNVQTARIGTDVFTLYQLPGEEWQVHRRFSRPDMPETIQVGLVTYTDWEKANDFDPFYHNGHVLTGDVDPTPDQPFNPDLVAGFEYARFVRPDVPDALAGVDLRTQASDAELLTFLGEASNVVEGEPVVDPPVEPPVGNEDPSGMAVGMNLINVTDWSQSWVFRDAFKMSRPWASRLLNTTTYDQPYGGDLALDENGWVMQLDTTVNEEGQTVRQYAQTYLFSEGGNPEGIYRVEWSGEGAITFGANAIEEGITEDGRHYALLDVAEDQSLIITLSETNPDDYIRDIQLFMPDYNGQSLEMDNWQPGDEESPFHPLFLERLQPFDTIRFMQWQEVNQDSRDVVTADDLRSVNHATQATAGGRGGVLGVSVEYMVQLVNELDANAWFNMPHSADDDYVRTYAEYVRDNIDPDATINVEWSNEVWNYAFGFEANGWIGEQLELPENEGLTFTDIWAREARRDFAIWSEVFAGQEDRLVRVAAGQQNNAWLTGQLLERMNGEFDAVSSTSYAGLEGEHFDWVSETTAEQEIVDFVIENSVPWSLATQAAHVDFANQYSQELGRDIEFITYEGGSHLSAYGYPYEELVQSALDSPAMRDVYEILLHGMEQLGVDMHTQYVFTGQGEPSPWGEFAVLRDMDMPLEEAHEYRALVDYINGDLAQPATTVSIEATDASAHELGDEAEFTVTRSGGLTFEELTVAYTVSGTATNGEDYTSLSGTVVIPAGETSTSIVVTPLLDSQASGDEGNEAIVLTLASADTYIVNGVGLDSATATLIDNEFVLVDDQTMNRNQDTLQIALPDELGGVTVSYDAAIVDNLAAGLNAENGFYVFQADFGENWGGQSEKWVRGSDGGYFYILPTGDFFEWSGSFEASTLLASLDTSFYNDPALLTIAEPIAVDVSVSDNTLTIDPSSQFAGEFAVELTSTVGSHSSSQTFVVSVVNSAPQIASLADRTVLVGSDTLLVDLSASDPDGDPLTYEVQVAGSLASEIMAAHNLYEISGQDDYALNWGGQNEKWLQGDNGWYFLLPDGTLNEWDGSFENSSQLAAFSTEIYDDPQLLLNATAPAISAEVVDGQLVITPGNQTGVFEIEVIVSDGFESDRASFNLDVTNTAPELSIADQSATSGVALEIALPAVDADGHQIVYSIEVLGDELSALNNEHGFWSEGNYYDNYLGQNERWIRDAENQWHYLLPNGELHRWDGSFDASPLIASLGSEVYDDASLLTDPQAAPVTAVVENGLLIITSAAGYTGDVQIRVAASDGYAEVSTTFRVSVSASADDDFESVDNVYAEWELLEV